MQTPLFCVLLACHRQQQQGLYERHDLIQIRKKLVRRKETYHQDMIQLVLPCQTSRDGEGQR